MRQRYWVAALGVCMLGSAHATSGRVIVDQKANPDMQREAVRAELQLTQAIAYPRDWVDQESRWAVLAVPASVDLAGLRNSLDPDAWVSRHVQSEQAVALRFMLDTDGDSVEMYVYDRGRLQLGASGTMGHIDAPRIENNRLRGHYVHFGDLFGSSVVIDLQLDAELWQAPKSTPLPADGGAPGAAYLALVGAIKAGDRAAIQAMQPKDRPAPSDSEFAEMLPMMQAMTPKQPRITGGKLYGSTARIELIDESSQAPASAEMRQEDGHWVLVRARSGTADSTQLPEPPAFADTSADLCPSLMKDGVVCGDLKWKDQPLAIRHVLGIQSDNERHLVLLAPAKLDAAHAAALWDEEAALEPLFGNAPARGLLLAFDGAHGALSATEGYAIDPEEGFSEEFMLRGEAVRIGDRIYGAYTVSVTDPDTGDAKATHTLRFDTPVLDKR